MLYIDFIEPLQIQLTPQHQNTSSQVTYLRSHIPLHLCLFRHSL